MKKMRDPRIDELAKTLIHYSVRLQKGENILIENTGLEKELVKALIKEAYAVNAHPFVHIQDAEVNREWLMQAEPEQLDRMAKYELTRMKEMDAYIGIRSGQNTSELSDVPSDKMQLFGKHVSQPVHIKERVNHTKWVVLRYPTPSMAQLANQSTEAFEDFYFQVCNLDYAKMSSAMDALVELMDRTDQVHITGEGTDLTFSIKDIPSIKCAGEFNIPDGEVFTAPVRESVHGVIQYNTPSPYQGFNFENVRLEFENGQIITATANDTERITHIFDTDEGARYVGEFALGVNPYILHPMKDILFDEKIAGSFHFTPGQCYDLAPNGNDSSVHWDMVCIQRPEYGGGEIYFDDVLIRKDGLFVVDELKGLNPEALK